MADKAAAADQTSLEEAEAAATAAAAAEGDQLVADISRRCQELMEEKRRGLGIEMEGSFKARMSSVQNRYNSEKRRSITMWQTDILRMNKVFRDIARHLGSEWRPVFNILLQPLELTEAEVDMERRKVEKQKPFMQAYKALLTWKDLKDERGEDFDMLQLVEALKKVDKYELAEKTLDIMDSEGDGLMALHEIGKGITSGSVMKDKADSDGTEAVGAAGGAGGSDGNKGASAQTGSKQKTAAQSVASDSGLSDRNLLTLSKKLGEDWQKLGKCLGQSEEELQEVLEGEGSGYQGGFKTLWNWRDTLNEMEEEHNLQTLKQALLKVGKFELFSAVFQTN